MSVGEPKITRASHPSLGLAYDLALKTYDYADRRFDLLGTRAAAIVGFTSILVSGASSLVSRLHAHRELQMVSALIFLTLIGYVLFHAVHAYKGREVRALPDPGAVFAKCAHLDEDDFRVELTGQIRDVCANYSAVCALRSEHVRKALYAFATTSGILLPALMLVP